MNRKELELIRWRDHFASNLEARTAELGSSMDARIEDSSRLAAILDSVAQGIIEINDIGLIRSLNRTAHEILGYSSEDLVGKHIDVLSSQFSIFDSLSGIDICADSSILLNQRSGLDLKYISKTGEEKLLVWNAAKIRSAHKSFGVVIAITDLSERRRLQAALLQQRDDFVAVIKHRLQINIFALQRVVNLILDNAFGALTTEQHKTVSVLAETIDDTENVLDMLVDIYLYKNSQKQLQFSNVTIAELVSQAANSVPVNKGKRLVIDSPFGELQVSGDRDELQKLVKHLLLNGMRFASKKVEIRFVNDDSGSQIIITDDGPGISELDIPHLFDRFFQESAAGKHTPVTGIGLCLCFEIARAHNGKIECQSKSGKGTKFVLTLPEATTVNSFAM